MLAALGRRHWAESGWPTKRRALREHIFTGPNAMRAVPPRLLCRPELVSMVAGCLPTAWRLAKVVAVRPDSSVEDVFDSLIGHLAGRHQPEHLPTPADWAMLFRQANAFVQARPWQR